MLLPRYSIRFLLGVMVAVSLFGTLLTFGLRGSPAALAVSVAIGSFAIVLVVHGFFLAVVGILARILPEGKTRTPNDPASPRPALPEAPR